MNQLCRVCGEPAAGFHFGAFTCEGCKSFFGRTCNNVSSLGECKNGSKCVITRKNRTACKACRLRKCIGVGMSKSGSRYGRRSNWFKIHCLLQEQTGSSSAMSVEETKRILEKLKASNVVSGHESGTETPVDYQPDRFSDDAHCASSPTISSTDAHEANTSREESPTESPPSHWFIPKAGGMPPEALSLFTALSPFLLPPGLPLPQNAPHIQALSQYFPLLSLITTSAKLGLPHSQGSSFSLQESGEEIPGQRELSLSLCAAEELRRRHLSSLIGGGFGGHEIDEAKKETEETQLNIMAGEATPEEKPPSQTVISNPPSEGARESSGEGSIPVSPSSGKNRARPRLDRATPKLKAVFIDRMKRSGSPPALEGTSRKRRAAGDPIPFGSPEQDEPIDLSVKGFSVGTGAAVSTPSPPVLACSMTVTPIDNFRSPVYTRPSPNRGSFPLGEESHSDSQPEQGTPSTAVDLSCRG